MNYRLPDGKKLTTSTRRYVREWRKLCKPICDEWGWKIHGFDGIGTTAVSFLIGFDYEAPKKNDHVAPSVVYMSISLVRKINALIAAKKSAK